MTNGNYTVFGRKKDEAAWMESMICDTPIREQYESAISKAKQDGYIITRIYKPDTELSAPNFAAAVNL